VHLYRYLYRLACIALDNKIAIVCTVGGPSLNGVTSETANCLVDQCEAVAFLGLEPGASAQPLVACRDLIALLKQPDETQQKQTLLKNRIDTLNRAL